MARLRIVTLPWLFQQPSSIRKHPRGPRNDDPGATQPEISPETGASCVAALALEGGPSLEWAALWMEWSTRVAPRHRSPESGF
jgi:hypothetical protein